MEIRLESGPARDKYAGGSFLFARLEFSETHLTVSLGPDCPESQRMVTKMWEHTVYELERLAMGIRSMALSELPEYHEVPSRDMLIGPMVSLGLCFWSVLGQPWEASDGRGTMFFCSRHQRGRPRRVQVHLEAMNDFRSERCVFEIEEALELAEILYEQAKLLAPEFIKWE